MSRTVSTIDYKALAERLEMHAECHAHVEPYDDEQRQWAADLRTVVSLLDGMAEAQPIYAYEWDTYGGGVRRSFSPAPYNGREPKRTLILYTHPAPQPQPEPIDPHMIVAEDRFPDEPEPTEAQPMSEDYIRGYDAGFIVGAEKGRSEPTEAQDVPVLEQLRRMAEDAARYRWLRGSSCRDHSLRWTQWEIRHWRAPFWSSDLRYGDLDAAIDAAMAKEARE